MEIEKLPKGEALVKISLMMFLVITLAMSLAAAIHEMGHKATAEFLGCDAEALSDVYTGVTGFECPNLTGLELQKASIIIALAGPLLALAYGLIMWFQGKDSILRLFGMIALFYSVFPSLFPLLPNSDMYKAIEWGLNPIIGWAIYIAILGYCGTLLAIEIKDKLPKKLEEWLE